MLLLGASFGLTPETALALSLLKRSARPDDGCAGARCVAAPRKRTVVAPNRQPRARSACGKSKPRRDDRGSSLVS